MKVRVFGFEWQLGAGIPVDDFCTHLNSLPGPPDSKKVVAIHDLGNFLGGVIISIKDMKAYCEMKIDGGKFKISPQQLERNARIADFNFFVIHKETHKGLYQHYHQSTATTSFCNFCRQKYNNLRNSKIKADIDKAGGEEVISKKDKKDIYQKYKGTFGFSILLKPENFKTYVQQMKLIKDFNIEFSSIEEPEKAYLPAAECSKRVAHRFVFSEESPVEMIKKKVLETLNVADAKKAQVHGVGDSGEEVIYRLYKDYNSFEEMEYDDIIDSISIDSEDLETSIKESEMISLLLKVAGQPSTKQLLTKPTK
ncbi:hypothetical protein [Geobacter sulfurreducens]|uniref:hypothetical protein n=1 Tax=Geobacter sulfurreducens TaxID=35554 RepID=UPI0020B6A8A1|nr:hypothetical protein [Geobacter sulfurreducens]UTG93647.1 hypothetical protein J8622_04795 [Geobacter sulfurreducens]